MVLVQNNEVRKVTLKEVASSYTLSKNLTSKKLSADKLKPSFKLGNPYFKSIINKIIFKTSPPPNTHFRYGF
ncbi:hypothetical protein COC58_22410 [Bacillus cereus]|nr:hypothetical protein BAQ44_26200 [Bacillus mobilis]PFO74517.1 hypothetical protein COJ86_07250 [Bacillus cereus]PGS38090.1 hypothetical protein COC58_22410 [Bacillus cereus]PGU46342.1 hypothetical protein COD91_07290 [Bacillus cereus]